MIKMNHKKSKKLRKLLLFLKFPYVYLCSNMEDRILVKAAEMFLNLGFKSVTMDEIANELGVSKKTIYKYFSNKLSLVDAATQLIHKELEDKIQFIKSKGYNAIEEEFAIKAVFKEMLKNTKESPMYQLLKYYPDVHARLMVREERLFRDCKSDNLLNGITQGLYRDNIEIKLIIKFYFTLIFEAFNSDLLAHDVSVFVEVEYKILEYHVRAIATEKGIKELEKQLNINNQNK